MKILLSGEGGQGVQAGGEILALAAFLEGKNSSLIPNFGVEQRGGVSLAFVKIGDGNYPKFDKADILAIFCDRAIERTERYVGLKTKVIVGPQVSQREIKKGWLKLDNKGLPAKVWNILIIGKIRELSEAVSKESMIKALREKFSDKFKENPQLEKINLQALK